MIAVRKSRRRQQERLRAFIARKKESLCVEATVVREGQEDAGCVCVPPECVRVVSHRWCA